MSASFQAFPQLGPPPPGMIYPTTTTATTPTTTNVEQDSSHSSGSFGMVFVVLAIILVVSAVACVLGRFCTKKSNKGHQPKAHKHSSHNNHNNNNHYNHKSSHKGSHKGNHKHGGPRPRDPDLEFGFRSKEGDIMMGFEPKGRGPPTSKVANNGDFRGDGRFGSGRGMDHDGMMPRDFP